MPTICSLRSFESSAEIDDRRSFVSKLPAFSNKVSDAEDDDRRLCGIPDVIPSSDDATSSRRLFTLVSGGDRFNDCLFDSGSPSPEISFPKT